MEIIKGKMKEAEKRRDGVRKEWNHRYTWFENYSNEKHTCIHAPIEII